MIIRTPENQVSRTVLLISDAEVSFTLTPDVTITLGAVCNEFGYNGHPDI